ncbi:MAG: hypothetical protein ACRDQ7_14750 [Haloechinothrix sp.]
MKVRNVLIIAALIQANVLMFLALIGSVLVAAGLFSLASALSPEEGVPAPADADSTVEREHRLVFGESYTFKTDAGSVRMRVAKPKVVTFHLAAYDEDCAVDPDTCTKPGAKAGTWLRVSVDLEGVFGRVETGGMFDYTYENPTGDVMAEGEPTDTFEPTRPLSSQVSALSKGQKVRGEVFFEASSADGKVIVTPIGDDMFTAAAPVIWVAK